MHDPFQSAGDSSDCCFFGGLTEQDNAECPATSRGGPYLHTHAMLAAEVNKVVPLQQLIGKPAL